MPDGPSVFCDVCPCAVLWPVGVWVGEAAIHQLYNRPVLGWQRIAPLVWLKVGYESRPACRTAFSVHTRVLTPIESDEANVHGDCEAGRPTAGR